MPYRLHQHHGMLQALMVLMHSTKPGQKQSTAQYETAQKAQGTLTVLWEASPSSGINIALSSSGRKGRFIVTLCPSESRWYECFALGISTRMGDAVSQDRAYSIEIMHKLLELFESEWEDLGFNMAAHDLSACMLLLVSCLGGMRGFEVLWTDLGTLRCVIEYCEFRDNDSAVSWHIIGRFKGKDGKLSCYILEGQTQASAFSSGHNGLLGILPWRDAEMDGLFSGQMGDGPMHLTTKIASVRIGV